MPKSQAEQRARTVVAAHQGGSDRRVLVTRDALGDWRVWFKLRTITDDLEVYEQTLRRLQDLRQDQSPDEIRKTAKHIATLNPKQKKWWWLDSRDRWAISKDRDVSALLRRVPEYGDVPCLSWKLR